MNSLYFKIAYNLGTQRLEYHTGSDRRKVYEMQSFSSGIRPDVATAAQVARAVDEWYREIALYDMKPAR